MEHRGKEPIQAQSQSHSLVQSTGRLKTDKAWAYATLSVDEKGRKTLICNFCQNVIHGGGINGVKKPLSGVGGEIASCKKVTSEVRFTMQGLLKETAQKAKDKVSGSGIEGCVTIEEEEEEVKSTPSLHPFFTKDGGLLGAYWNFGNLLCTICNIRFFFYHSSSIGERVAAAGKDITEGDIGDFFIQVDTTSMLYEATEYIKFLHEQVIVSSPIKFPIYN